MSEPIVVDVFADLACPWCYIGKTRLERALAARPAGSVLVRHRAYELQPQLPPEGVDAASFFASKFGPPERLAAIFERVTSVGAADGLRFDFGRMKRAPNTFLAHRIVKLAGRQGLEGPVLQALYRAHFTEGIDLCDRAAALDFAASEVPALDRAAVESALADGGATEAVRLDERLAAELGVTAVPFFLAAGRVALRGAGEASELAALLDQAAKSSPAELPIAAP